MEYEELIKVIKKAGLNAIESPHDAAFFRTIENKLEEWFIQVEPAKLKPEIFSLYLDANISFSTFNT